ncbi:MAG: Nif3-like dinuclear metal center hexameric protein [Oscillospiraceae bacterium]|nr:Nif3-like dinuclear metal center hexameric protein [Oscillospiraceae bacterium]
MTIQDIYQILDAYAPFSLQESYDKSGLLVGDPAQKVKRVLLTLDITIPVVQEACDKKAELILSHHPVIWDPLKSISPAHPVWHLVQQNIGAICSHTCMDIAKGGLNDYVGKMMSRSIGMTREWEPLAILPNNRTLGRTAALANAWNAKALARQLKAVFQCADLRFYEGKQSQYIRKLAWCTGSGGDLIADAIAAGADALVTGDCKHSVWAEAQNRNFTLFDCGHFETEAPVVHLFRQILQHAAPKLEILISESGTRPFYHVV